MCLPIFATRQMRDYGGMVSFLLGSEEEALDVVARTKVFTLAESLGGVESLVNHPAIMTHASVPKERRDMLGITDGLVRISVGIEDVEDLQADLEQALTKAIMNIRERGGVAVVMAHRPSALANVDLVLAMANGEAKAFGPRDEILAKVTQPSPSAPPLAVVAAGAIRP